MTLRAEWLAFLAGMGESPAPTADQWVYVLDFVNRAVPDDGEITPAKLWEVMQGRKPMHWSNNPNRCAKCGLDMTRPIICGETGCPALWKCP